MIPGRGRDETEVLCPHCGAAFAVPKSMRGGMANCPHCHRAVQIPGGYEPEFWLLWGLGAAFVVLVSWGAFVAGGLGAGLVVFLVGMLILGAITLAS